MRPLFSLLLLAITFSAAAQDKLITLEDLWRDGTFAVKSVPGFNALKDGERYTDVARDSDQRIIRIKSLRDGTAGAVLYKGDLDIDGYEISEKEDKLLLLTESQ